MSNDGITIFPRFITPAQPEVYTPQIKRVQTGIPGLDDLLAGGLLSGSTTLLTGDPGAGKTVTALHFLLNGVQQGQSGVYISFQEDPFQLKQIARNFGYDMD
ncbi:MAG: RAD55 family ATPase, partial [Anaerolineales bacterium]